jgi:LCP family protein required for cell wall assembly
MMNMNGKRGGKHAAGSKRLHNSKKTENGKTNYRDENPVRDVPNSEQTRVYDRKAIADAANQVEKKKKRIWLRVLIGILVFLLAVGATLVALYFIYVKPPEVSDQINNDMQPQPDDTVQDDTPDDAEDDAEPTGRRDGVYTFALVGMDQVGANTDTIMIVTFDTVEHTMNVVSIPRDTLVNVSWSVKKVNSLYGNGGMDKLMDGLEDILGYEIDFHVLVDLNAFKTLVDEIGGVWFDVPQNMYYSDPTQDLYINIDAGYQCLNGEDAMGVVRFRATYVEGDIKRIEVQQEFMKAAIKQMLDNVGSMNISTLISIFLNDVDTDLTNGNCVWLAQEFFKMNMDDIEFMTMPGNYNDSVYGGSYVTIYIDEWLDMINTYLNPFYEEITVKDQDILTRDPDSGRIYATSGVYAGDASWGN